MDKLKRQFLALGLSITTLEVGFYIISQLITKNDEIISKIVFGICLVILLFNINSFYTVNLSAKEFKKKIYLPWISFSLTFIYSIYYLAVIIMNTHDGIHPIDTLMIANLFIILVGLILYIPGILKRVTDNKITYEEHQKQQKSKE